MAVGGTVSGGCGAYDFAPNNATASSFAALSVYGSVTSQAYRNDGPSGIAVAGSSNTTLELNTAGPVYIEQQQRTVVYRRNRRHNFMVDINYGGLTSAAATSTSAATAARSP